MEKWCVLNDEKVCVDCGECLMCDLDPEKRCDNCMECVEKNDADYAAIEIDEVIAGTSPDSAESARSNGSSAVKPSSVKAVRPKQSRKFH